MRPTRSKTERHGTLMEQTRSTYLVATVDTREDYRIVTIARIEHICDDLEASLRAALADFFATDQGRAAVKNTYGDFNWGDIYEVSNQHLYAHGILSIEAMAPTSQWGTLRVNHDERLAQDIDWQERR